MALGLAWLAQPALAQSQDSVDQSTIVVTGKRDTAEAAREFAGALTRRLGNRPLTRFEQAVCPFALGLSERHNAALVHRMRRVAAAANILVASERCNPNVVLVVTPDKGAFLRKLSQRKDTYFDQLPQAQVRRLLADQGQTAAWHLGGPPVTANGMEVRFNAQTEWYQNQTTEAASRLTTPARNQFVAAVVVVDAKAIEGLSITQLADYAAMRAFAAADPKRLPGNSPPTVLSVVAAPMGTSVPLSLTPWDLGFLRGLYGVPGNQYANAQRSGIAREVEEEVAKPKP